MSCSWDGHGRALPSPRLLSASSEGATSLSWFCRRNDMNHAKGPTQALCLPEVTPVHAEGECPAWQCHRSGRASVPGRWTAPPGWRGRSDEAELGRACRELEGR